MKSLCQFFSIPSCDHLRSQWSTRSVVPMAGFRQNLKAHPQKCDPENTSHSIPL